MEKATRIISKIVAITLIVLSAISIVGILISLFTLGFNSFSIFILPLLLTIAELVIAILLLLSCKELASVKFLVMISVMFVLIILDRFALGGSIMGAAGTITGLLQSFAIVTVFSILGILLLLAAAAALALGIVCFVQAKKA